MSRRALQGAGAFGLAMPHLSQASAETVGGERVLRYGISMNDIPLTTGQPDRGAGAYQFTGYTLYDPRVACEMDVDRLGARARWGAMCAAIPRRSTGSRI